MMRTAFLFLFLVLVASPAWAADYPTATPRPVPGINTAAPPRAAAAGHWTFPGTIEGHLRTGHGVDPRGLTREQMLQLHDQLHTARAASPAAVYYAPGGCPGGVCPVPAARVRRYR